MRKKLNAIDKRGCYIGIKVKPETKDQLFYISKRDVVPVSTLVNSIIKDYTEKYFQIAKIDWDSLPEDEKRGGK